MKAAELRQKYVNFFIKKGHKLIPSASLIPENDPSALFISAGMHPLVPYLLGEPHPLGRRLCSVQKCVRTVDIDTIGDTFHQTFFEMLGNWSLGDYWKDTMIPWSFEFLTKELGIPAEKISVTCFAGDQNAPRDDESAKLWIKVGIPRERIYFLPKADNWWGPAGKTGPCGPDTEMFFDTGRKACGSDCRPWDNCGRYFEIWNDVFMQYTKTDEGKYEPLKQKNVDTGMGIDRTITVLSGLDDSYQNDLFAPIIGKIEEISRKSYQDEVNKKPMRIIADHIRAATFLVVDGVVPSNTEQGYILRRLLRRAIRHGRALQVNKVFATEVAESVIEVMSETYPELKSGKQEIFDQLNLEEEKFLKMLGRGINALKRIFGRAIGGVDPENLPEGMIGKNNVVRVDGKEVFHIYETYGFPPELSQEVMTEWGLRFDDQTMRECNEAFNEHQKLSKSGAEKKFTGGLADYSEQVIKYHTATHLLHAALRKILGEHVHQIGSNLTAERLRFDFTHPEKLTEEQLGEIQSLVNQKIKENLPVKMEVVSLDEAKKAGALAFFEQKYTEKVKVYTVGPSASSGLPFSKEVCGGPHVRNTSEIGEIEIYKEEAVGGGKRRVYVRITS